MHGLSIVAIYQPPQPFQPYLFYDYYWLLLTILLLLVIGAVIVVIFYITRHKPIKTLQNLYQIAPHSVNKQALREKYLRLIGEVRRDYMGRKIKASVAHQQLSLLVRLYYSELVGFHAEVMTLADLKLSRHKKLAALIGKYYPHEFDMLEQGDVSKAVELACHLVEEP